MILITLIGLAADLESLGLPIPTWDSKAVIDTNPPPSVFETPASEQVVPIDAGNSSSSDSTAYAPSVGFVVGQSEEHFGVEAVVSNPTSRDLLITRFYLDVHSQVRQVCDNQVSHDQHTFMERVYWGSESKCSRCSIQPNSEDRFILSNPVLLNSRENDGLGFETSILPTSGGLSGYALEASGTIQSGCTSRFSLAFDTSSLLIDAESSQAFYVDIPKHIEVIESTQVEATEAVSSSVEINNLDLIPNETEYYCYDITVQLATANGEIIQLTKASTEVKC